MNHGTMIKICGLTRPEEAAYLNEAGVDFAGFIQFVPKSRRNLQPEQAERIIRELDPGIHPVAVTVSPTAEMVREIQATGFRFLQIHGRLDADVRAEIRLPIIRAIQAHELACFPAAQEDPKVAWCLLDAAVPGSGKTFDWHCLQALPARKKPVFLAGGLRPENVLEALRTARPDGIDVSSGVECDNGAGKSREKILELVNLIRREE